MRRLRRSAATVRRLLTGGLRSIGDRWSWESRLRAIESAGVVSFDLFGTLLLKAPGFDEDLLAAVSREILAKTRRLGVAGFPDEAAVRANLSRIQRMLTHQALAKENDPEIPRRALYEGFFGALPKSFSSEAMVEEVLEYELARVHQWTTLNPEVLELVRFCRDAGKRVIAITDSYIDAGRLTVLLRLHGVEGFAATYASCDAGRSKFRGGLFDLVLAREGILADRLLHIGDNLAADVYSARSRGIRSLHYRGEGGGGRLSGDPRFRLGFESLGPVFAAFGHLLLLEVKRSGVTRLAFVARDGEFLRAATARLISAAPFLPQPKLDYVYLSRRTTALPARPRLDRTALEEVRRVRAHGQLIDLFFEYFGLDRNRFAPAAASDVPSILELLEDPGFRDYVKDERHRQASLLAGYLHQEKLFGTEDAAFVDVGWRGSSQRDLCEAFAAEPDFIAPRFYYLALWSESGDPAPGGPSVGILADKRRRASIQESAAWHLAFLFEAVCRAAHGTVTGFRRDTDGVIRPRLADDTPGRLAESVAESGREAIREGVLSYLDHYGQRLSPSGVDQVRLRRNAQREMLRLAFFPRTWELDAVSGMVHTEGHADGWSAPLIDPTRISPLLSPQRWIAGLSSPWRAGYVAATGGYPFALAFFCLETVLGAAPPALRRRLREWALRLARPRDPVHARSESERAGSRFA